MNQELYNEMLRVLNSIHNNAKSAQWLEFPISASDVTDKIEELADEFPEFVLDLYEVE